MWINTKAAIIALRKSKNDVDNTIHKICLNRTFFLF